MRLSTRASPHICLPCRLRAGRESLASGRAFSFAAHRQPFSSLSRLPQIAQAVSNVESARQSLTPIISETESIIPQSRNKSSVSKQKTAVREKPPGAPHNLEKQSTSRPKHRSQSITPSIAPKDTRHATRGLDTGPRQGVKESKATTIHPPKTKVVSVACKQPLPPSFKKSVPIHAPRESLVSQRVLSPSISSEKSKPAPVPAEEPVSTPSIDSHSDPFSATMRGSAVQSVSAQGLALETLESGKEVTLPQLSFDLSRVLFNPGVHQLQDPRSRVYNFDPYLEKIMPVSEFNYDALNPYTTSSEDQELLRLARANEKRYIGSSSSMTSAMSQFHYLLSGWRDLNLESMTRGFKDNLRTFTVINRAPAAIFLRYRDGVYAVDADKEYDEPNVLMSLGKSLEKLLTVEKDEFETWRKTAAVSDGRIPESQPEMFHYSSQGRFLLRSQLDAWDPRLAGTGYFDLKTRAAAGIRMNIQDYEVGKGYQIQERFGTWRSYEREYYDMARSTFLKYSLQARMGAMDGIFVAYHNIVRMFGFQYIPLSEMDLVLHGQSDPCLGDQEFRLTLKLMEEIFNMGTNAFPQKSLRIHFAAREPSLGEKQPYMQIFIEAMDEDEIKEIQNSNKAQFEEFERRVLNGDTSERAADALDVGDVGDVVEETPGVEEQEFSQAPSAQTGPDANAANTAFLNTLFEQTPADLKPKPAREIMGLKLTVQNKINERPVTRPDLITTKTRWTVNYKLERTSDDVARRECNVCKTRRMGALKQALARSSDDHFLRELRKMNEDGAIWRRQQDELDAQREPVLLYQERRSALA